MEKMIRIDIICSNQNKYSVRYSVRTRVVEFKNDLAELTGFPADEFRLTYKGDTLEDHQTLDHYGMEDHHAIYMEQFFDPGFTMTEPSPPSDTTTGGKMIMIEIIYLNGDIFSVRSSVGAKVADFKELLAEVYFVPAEEQRLIYRRQTLQDDRTLESYGLEEFHTIHMDRPKVRLPGVTPDMSLLYQVIFQMTQTLLSSPQLREQFIDENKEVLGMFDSNTELNDMIQNPEVVRCLTSPQMMQAPPVQHSIPSAAGPSASFSAMAPESLLELPIKNPVLHSIPSAAGPSASFSAMAPESRLELPRQNPIQHSIPYAAGPSKSFSAMAPESQLELPRQNPIRHSIPSAAGPSESFSAMVYLSSHELPIKNRVRHSIPSAAGPSAFSAMPKLPRQNPIRHSKLSAAGPSTSFSDMVLSQHFTLLADVEPGPSTATDLQLQRSSDMKYQIAGWVILGIVVWRASEILCTSVS